MSDGRAVVLADIRQALHDVPRDEDPSTRSLVRSYKRYATSGTGALAESFVVMLIHYGVQVSQARRHEVAARVDEILARRKRHRLVVPADFPSAYEPANAEIVRDHGLGYDEIAAMDGALTLCALGVAQTGTILLDHRVGQGRRVLTLLPDYHLCLIETSQIVALVPEAVERSADAVRAGHPLTFVSGPSATSDIELNRVQGVHGPRTLDVLLIRDSIEAPDSEPFDIA